jgi:hypothetical protein
VILLREAIEERAQTEEQLKKVLKELGISIS